MIYKVFDQGKKGEMRRNHAQSLQRLRYTKQRASYYCNKQNFKISKEDNISSLFVRILLI